MKISLLIIILYSVVILTYGQHNSFTERDEPEIYISKFKDNKACALSYTFDDGLEEHFTLIYPRFEELGFKGTFWVNGNTINEGEAELQENKPRISWENLKKMADVGHEISNHGWSHLNLTRISLDEAYTEILKNDSIIKANVGLKPLTFCYAFNSKNDTIIKMASIGRVDTRTKQFAMGRKSTPESLKAKMDELIRNKEWGVAMIHGISYEYDAFTDVNILWNHFEEVKKQEDRIWVDTFKAIAAYTKEQQSTAIDIRKKGRKLLITPHMKLDQELFSSSLTLVIKAKNVDRVKIKQNNQLIEGKIEAEQILFNFDPNGGTISVEMKY